MKTELALSEFLASRIASNLSPRTIEWYEDRLHPFAKFCPKLPRQPWPIESFLTSVQGSPDQAGHLQRPQDVLQVHLHALQDSEPDGRYQSTAPLEDAHGHP